MIGEPAAMSNNKCYKPVVPTFYFLWMPFLINRSSQAVIMMYFSSRICFVFFFFFCFVAISCQNYRRAVIYHMFFFCAHGFILHNFVKIVNQWIRLQFASRYIIVRCCSFISFYFIHTCFEDLVVKCTNRWLYKEEIWENVYVYRRAYCL